MPGVMLLPLMKPTCWKVDTRTVSLRELLPWCLSHHEVDRMLVILPPSPSRWRYDQQDRDRVGAVYDRTNLLFGSYILEKLPVSAWPGTELIGGVASAFVIEFNEKVKDVMLSVEPDLCKWRLNTQPPLPEDICLFKAADSYPAFISISHERLAWLISEKRPDLSGVSMEKEKYRPKPEALIFSGKYYCRQAHKKK
jgi:hypothetical protein